MKLSFSTLGCPRWSLNAIIDAAGRYGYDGVELRFIEDDDALWARAELTGSGLRETRARLRDAGLAVSCVDSRSFLHHPPGKERDRALDEAVRCAELAARLGAAGIRVFGDKVQDGQDRDSTRRLVAEGLGQIAGKTRPLGVEVWIESHGDFARARDTLDVVERTGSDGAGVLWDPANAFEAGEDPAEGYAVLRDLVRHVHLKDLHDDSSPALPGRGSFGPQRVLALLSAAGYDRWVSFEWEKKWHPGIEEPEVALPHFIRWASQELLPSEPRAGLPPVRAFACGRLSVEVHADRPAVGRAAAAVVSEHLRSAVERDGRTAAIFASAPSQNEFLAALREDTRVPWEKITAFHLDEYIGVSPGHPASFRRFLTDRLFDHVPVRAFHGLDGEAAEPAAECERYAALLREEAPGLAILGVGENGHLAFIDPPFCDFAEPLDVRVTELDEACRLQQVHEGAFPALADVPRTALSLSIPFLMRVARAVAIVPGPAKRAAIKAALEGPVTCACPASILRRHPHATLFLDEASAGGLTR
jgi:glucosamine-6-phosphate deaminase